MNIPPDNERLRAIRSALGKTQKEMSEVAGITQGAYSDVERGRSFVSFTVLKKIFLKFDVNPIYFLTGRGGVFLGDTDIDEVGTDTFQVKSNRFNPVSKSKSNPAKSGSFDGDVNGDVNGDIFAQAQKKSTHFDSVAGEPDPEWPKKPKKDIGVGIPVVFQGETDDYIHAITIESPFTVSARISLSDLRLSDSKYFTIQVSGDAMTPTIKHLDYVVCQEVTDPRYCRKGEVYLVIIPQGAICMRLRADWNGTGNMPLSGDNPEAGDLDIRAQDILQLWRARAVLSLDLGPLKGLFKSQFTASELAQLREAFKDL